MIKKIYIQFLKKTRIIILIKMHKFYFKHVKDVGNLDNDPRNKG